MLYFAIALLVSTSVSSGAHQHGIDLYKQQKYSEAIAVLQDVVKTEKADSAEYKESLLLIGQSYFMLSQAPKAIPWLLLGAVSNAGEGIFAPVTYVQRVNTVGGTAPAAPGATAGDVARVPYTAEYVFYRARG